MARWVGRAFISGRSSGGALGQDRQNLGTGLGEGGVLPVPRLRLDPQVLQKHRVPAPDVLIRQVHARGSTFLLRSLLVLMVLMGLVWAAHFRKLGVMGTESRTVRLSQSRWMGTWRDGQGEGVLVLWGGWSDRLVWKDRQTDC